VFVAGATGVLGIEVVTRLTALADVVTGMTRSPGKAALLETLGARPVVCDVYDAAALAGHIFDARPDVLLQLLTDLPDDRDDRRTDGANARIRREGTRNLLDAAHAAEVGRVIAASVAWPLPGDEGDAAGEMERAVLDVGGVIVRLGRLSGPGTWYEHDLPPAPRIDVGDAADRLVLAMDAPSGAILVATDGAERSDTIRPE
jgi:uncharacterized protein YbjT (DUF2867 family)